MGRVEPQPNLHASASAPGTALRHGSWRVRRTRNQNILEHRFSGRCLEKGAGTPNDVGEEVAVRPVPYKGTPADHVTELAWFNAAAVNWPNRCCIRHRRPATRERHGPAPATGGVITSPRQDEIRNLLLRRMSASDFALLAPHLQAFRADRGKLLFHAEVPVDYAFF